MKKNVNKNIFKWAILVTLVIRQPVVLLSDKYLTLPILLFDYMTQQLYEFFKRDQLAEL